MTPHEARLWTLKELQDWAKKEKQKYEGKPFIIDGIERQYINDEYWAYEAMEEKCEELINQTFMILT